MIEKYIEAIISNDYKELSACFAPKCRYFDYTPNMFGRPSYHLYGPKGVEMFFRNKFTFRLFTISDYVIEDSNTATFMVSYQGKYVYARAAIEKLSPDGLIDTITVKLA